MYISDPQGITGTFTINRGKDYGCKSYLAVDI